jgi:hypothetical protein
MPSLSLRNLQGSAQYNDNIIVPENHNLKVDGSLNITNNFIVPTWNNSNKPSENLSFGNIGFNLDTVSLELYDGGEWIVVAKGLQDYEKIVKIGLASHLDAGVTSSYSRSGTTVSSLSGNISATLVNGVGYSTSNKGYFTFDGVDDYMTLSSSTDFSGDFSYGAWVYRSVVSPNGYTNLFTSTLQNEQLQLDTTGFPGSIGMYVNGAYSQTEDNVIPLNQWCHVVYQRNGTTLNGWVNGVRVFNGENDNGYGSVSTAQSRVNKIGAYSTGTSYNLNGRISNIQIYSRSLSTKEIWKNYTAMAPRFDIVTNTTPITNGLVLYYDVANANSYSGSGTSVVDLSGNSNTGTLTNTPSYSSSYGGEFQFDGSTQSIEVANSSSLSFTNQFTVSIWCSTTSMANYDGIIGKNSSGAWADGWAMYFESPSNLYFYVNSWNTYRVGYNLNSTGFDLTNFVGVYNGTNLQLYKDGLLVSTGSSLTASVLNTTANLGIMRVSPSNYYAPGKFYNTMIYNRALTKYEIAQNFNAFRSRYDI